MRKDWARVAKTADQTSPKGLGFLGVLGGMLVVAFLFVAAFDPETAGMLLGIGFVVAVVTTILSAALKR